MARGQAHGLQEEGETEEEEEAPEEDEDVCMPKLRAGLGPCSAAPHDVSSFRLWQSWSVSARRLRSLGAVVLLRDDFRVCFRILLGLAVDAVHASVYGGLGYFTQFLRVRSPRILSSTGSHFGVCVA